MFTDLSDAWNESILRNARRRGFCGGTPDTSFSQAGSCIRVRPAFGSQAEGLLSRRIIVALTECNRPFILSTVGFSSLPSEPRRQGSQYVRQSICFSDAARTTNEAPHAIWYSRRGGQQTEVVAAAVHEFRAGERHKRRSKQNSLSV